MLLLHLAVVKFKKGLYQILAPFIRYLVACHLQLLQNLKPAMLLKEQSLVHVNCKQFAEDFES